MFVVEERGKGEEGKRKQQQWVAELRVVSRSGDDNAAERLGFFNGRFSFRHAISTSSSRSTMWWVRRRQLSRREREDREGAREEGEGAAEPGGPVVSRSVTTSSTQSMVVGGRCPVEEGEGCVSKEALGPGVESARKSAGIVVAAVVYDGNAKAMEWEWEAQKDKRCRYWGLLPGTTPLVIDDDARTDEGSRGGGRGVFIPGTTPRQNTSS